MQRGTALDARLLRHIAQAQPLAARRAVRVQALNCAAGQSVHGEPPSARVTRGKRSVNERDSAPEALVSQEEYLLLVVVRLPKAQRRVWFEDKQRKRI
jgi:hypothetical protein